MHGHHHDIAPLCALSGAERARALEHYSVIQPCVEHAVPLAHVAHHHGLPLRTVQRWLAQYRRAGLAGLARRGRSDRGHQRRRRAELKPVLEGVALRTPPPTVAFVHRHVCAVALQHGWSVPTDHSVHRVVKHLDPALLTLAHAGTQADRTTVDWLDRRDAGTPNEMWQADHTRVDRWVQQGSGAPARPWLTVMMEDDSRAIAGCGGSVHAPSAIQTALVLRQAIWRKPLPQGHMCGIPATFDTDHGRDGTSQHLAQVSAELTMGLVCSDAGMPRGRGRIERFFRTIHQRRLCGRPGYTPVGPPTGKTR
jgi:putative transposase